MNRISLLTCAALLGACSSSESVVRDDARPVAGAPVPPASSSIDAPMDLGEPSVAEPMAADESSEVEVSSPAAPMVETRPDSEVEMEPRRADVYPVPVIRSQPGPEWDVLEQPAALPPASAEELQQVRAGMLASIRAGDLGQAMQLHAGLEGRVAYPAEDPRQEMVADLEALKGFVGAMQARQADSSGD